MRLKKIEMWGRSMEWPQGPRSPLFLRSHTNRVDGSYLSFLRCDLLFGHESHNFLEVTSGKGRGGMRDFVHTNSFLL